MRSKKIFFALIFSAALLSGISAFDIGESSISVSSEAITSPGLAAVTIHSTPNDARISLDGGISSYSTWTGNLTPGPHMISATAPDHYAAQFPIFVHENLKYTIDIRLEPHTGYLSIELYPVDALVYVDGSKVSGNMAEIPVGRHAVTVKKFGYEEAKDSILIMWHRTSTLNISLSPSTFAINGYKVRPERFNPANKGLYNRIALSFSVTAPGYGAIEISDSKGVAVYHEDLPVFKTWSQRFIWRGDDKNGSRLGDGDYQVKLSLWPLIRSEDEGSQTIPAAPTLATGATQTTTGGLVEPAIAYSTTVKIDSSSIIIPSGTSAARPGLLYFADPKVSELLPGSVEVVAGINSGVSVSLGFKVGDGTMIAAEAAYDAAPGGSLAGSVLRNVYTAAGFSAALLGRIAWSSAAAPTYPGSASEAELALPLAIGAGGLRAGIAPGVVFDLNTERLAGRIGAGLWFENPGFVVGLSAQGTFGAAAFMSPANPLYLAAESRILFDRLPFTVLIRLSGAFEPELASPVASVGFGVAW